MGFDCFDCCFEGFFIRCTSSIGFPKGFFGDAVMGEVLAPPFLEEALARFPDHAWGGLVEVCSAWEVEVHDPGVGVMREGGEASCAGFSVAGVVVVAHGMFDAATPGGLF